MLLSHPVTGKLQVLVRVPKTVTLIRLQARRRRIRNVITGTARLYLIGRICLSIRQFRETDSRKAMHHSSFRSGHDKMAMLEKNVVQSKGLGRKRKREPVDTEAEVIKLAAQLEPDLTTSLRRSEGLAQTMDVAQVAVQLRFRL
jgi:hypothetical protein